jgi:hypothetical protein
MIRAGAGQTQHRSSRAAGRAIAEEALAALGSASPRAALLHATVAYEQEALLGGIFEVLPGTLPLAGCSAEGVIGPRGSDEGSHAAALLLLGGAIEAASHLETGLGTDPRALGERLGRWIGSQDSVADPRLLLVFPDGLAPMPGEMVDALHACLPPGLKVAGGTAGDSMQMRTSFQYEGRRVAKDGVAALLLGGPLAPRLALTHGCAPVGPPMTVTATDGPWVLTLDDHPAWEIFRPYLDEPEEGPLVRGAAHLCLLWKPGEGRTPIARTPASVRRETGAIRFPGGIPRGARVQVALRDIDGISESALDRIEALLANTDSKGPACILHYECVGRGRFLLGHRINETLFEPLRDHAGAATTYFGFHTFGEIAGDASDLTFQNYTLVLCALFSRTPDAPHPTDA